MWGLHKFYTRSNTSLIAMARPRPIIMQCAPIMNKFRTFILEDYLPN